MNSVFQRVKQVASAIQTAKTIAAVISQSPVIPIPQQALNLVLPYLYKDIPEVQSMQLSIHDGYFCAEIRVKKWLEMATTLRFEIVGAKLTADEQYIQLRQMEKTSLYSDSFIGKIAVAIVEAIFFSLVKTDPVHYAANKQDGIVVQDGVYDINLGQLGLKDWLAQHPKTETFLKFGGIGEIRCVEGVFQAVPALNLSVPSQYLTSLTNPFKKQQATQSIG